MHNGYDPNTDHQNAGRLLSGLDTQFHPLNLNALVIETLATIDSMIGDKVVLQIECEQDLPAVSGVTTLVKVALVDLCKAATQRLGDGGRLVIKTSLHPDPAGGPFVCAQVRYEYADERAGNFVEFSGDLDGVHGIAQQHKGWIASADHGSGASYNFYLPLAKASEASMPFEEVFVEGGTETILLVEDETDLLTLTREMLEEYGYRIITASNGVAALKVWAEKHHEIDLLLTDMRMPEGISGHELAQRLRTEKPLLKVIYISGYTVEAAGALKLSEGRNFLTKPYTPPGLAQTVRRMLDWDETARAA